MRRRVLGLKAAATGSRQVSDTSKLKDWRKKKISGVGGRGAGGRSLELSETYFPTCEMRRLNYKVLMDLPTLKSFDPRI